MIGILGMYYGVNNFGSQLLARALWRAIEDQGYSCLWVRYDFKRGIPNPYVSKSISKELEDDAVKSYALNIQKEIEGRELKFQEFQDETPHTQGIYDILTLDNVLQECRNFVIGGDQIWQNFYYMDAPHVAESFTLDFVPDDQIKFSYSTSTGGDIPVALQKRLAPGLRRLDFISCREKSSIEMLQRLSGKNVRSILDPTFLLSRKKWNSIRVNADSIRGSNGNVKNGFGICYFVNRSTEWREAATMFCHNVGIDVLAFPHISESRHYKADYDFGDIRDFSSGPAEFLDLIDEAEIIITNSFHACVFSIIYNKPFFVLLNDESKASIKTNARIIDLLEEFDLSDRIVSADTLKVLCDIKKIDYGMTNSLLIKKREEALEFLKTALSLKKGE